MRRLGFDRRVCGLAEHRLVQIAKQSGKRVLPFASEQIGRLAALHQVGLQRANVGPRLIDARQFAAADSFRLDEQPLVVPLQQQEGLREAGNDVDQAAALRGGQLVSRSRLAHQRQRGLQFPGVLFKALAVQRVAADEVFAQGSGSPDPELGAARGLDPVPNRDDHIEVVEGHRLVGAGNVQILHIAFLVQLAFAEYVPDMLGNDRALAPE